VFALLLALVISEYRTKLLEMQEPIVQTCIQHRVSKRVYVEQ